MNNERKANEISAPNSQRRYRMYQKGISVPTKFNVTTNSFYPKSSRIPLTEQNRLHSFHNIGPHILKMNPK